MLFETCLVLDDAFDEFRGTNKYNYHDEPSLGISIPGIRNFIKFSRRLNMLFIFFAAIFTAKNKQPWAIYIKLNLIISNYIIHNTKNKHYDLMYSSKITTQDG